MRELDVYCNDTKAGRLTEKYPGMGYSFKYEEEYLKTDLPPISVNLPKQNAVHESEYLFPFFSNMLPEGTNKGKICRYFRLDEDDEFGLLTIMADGDFIGAVNVRTIQ